MFFRFNVRSRLDYNYFGVVCVSLTRGFNRYGIPLISIIWTNHHLQAILFECVLGFNERDFFCRGCLKCRRK